MRVRGRRRTVVNSACGRRPLIIVSRRINTCRRPCRYNGEPAYQHDVSLKSRLYRSGSCPHTLCRDRAEGGPSAQCECSEKTDPGTLSPVLTIQLDSERCRREKRSEKSATAEKLAVVVGEQFRSPSVVAVSSASDPSSNFS
jgi:hypothetical protein